MTEPELPELPPNEERREEGFRPPLFLFGVLLGYVVCDLFRRLFL